MTAQTGDEGLGFPGAERRVGAIALPPWRPAPSFRQLGIGRGLIDKDQSRQCLVEEWLSPVDPQVTRLGDLRPQLLGGLQAFFYGSAQADADIGWPSSGRPRRHALPVRRTIRPASGRRSLPCVNEPILHVP